MKNSELHELDRIFRKFKPIHFKRGEIIIRAGDAPRGIFYLKNGYVKVYSVSRSGEQLTLIIFKPGDIFPVSWAINSTKNEYFVETMTPAVLWRAGVEEFLGLISNNPKVLFDLNRRMMERFLGLMKRMEYMVFGNAKDKVSSILLICAERFGEASRGKAIIDVRLTHNEIANLVGMSRETVSIEMKKLEKKGLIGHLGRRIVINDERRLRKESQSDFAK